MTSNTDVWTEACQLWMANGLMEGCSLYYINIMFARLQGGQHGIVAQMHKAIEKGFYGPLCTRFCRHPPAAPEQDKLPRLWLFPDLPVRKGRDGSTHEIGINLGGLHFNG